MEPLAAQVEETVLEADFLGIFGIAEYRQRQALGRGLHFHVGRIDFDLAGAQLRVDRLGRSRRDLTGEGQHRLGAHAIDDRVEIGGGLDDDLGDPVMVAQIYEQHIGMLAGAVDPAREADFLTDIGGAELSAGVRAIGVHLKPRHSGEGRNLMKWACGARSRPSPG